MLQHREPLENALEWGRQATEMAGCQGFARMGGPEASSGLLITQRLTALSLQARKYSATPLQSRGALAFEEEANRPHLPVMRARMMLRRIIS